MRKISLLVIFFIFLSFLSCKSKVQVKIGENEKQATDEVESYDIPTSTLDNKEIEESNDKSREEDQKLNEELFPNTDMVKEPAQEVSEMPQEVPEEPSEVIIPEKPTTDANSPPIKHPEVINPPQVITTEQPKINECHNIEPGLIAIGGKCEHDAKIEIKNGNEKVKVSAYGEYFIAGVNIPANSSVTLEITAKVPGKARSEPIKREVTYKKNAFIYDDEWHIYLGNTSRGYVRSTLNDFEGKNLLSSNDISAFKKRINEKASWLKSNGMNSELIYLIVPNPITIYDDDIPYGIEKASEKTRLDQVIETINSTEACAIDLRPILKENRHNTFQPYLHTDTHWSEYGAYLGLSKLMEHISKKYPSAAMRPFEEYGFENKLSKGGDVIYYLEMNEAKQKEAAPFFNPSFELPVKANKYLKNSLRMDFDATSSRIRISTENEALPDCVVFRDSYGIALYEILPDRFNVTSYYHTWGYDFNKEFIKNAAPDYVIYIIAERNMDNILR